MTEAPRVAWVVGRKKALANALVLILLEMQGRDPRRVTNAEMRALAAEAELRVEALIDQNVLASFMHEWRDSTGGNNG